MDIVIDIVSLKEGVSGYSEEDLENNKVPDSKIETKRFILLEFTKDITQPYYYTKYVK